MARAADIAIRHREAARAAWQDLHSDAGAAFDLEHRFDSAEVGG